MVHPYTGHTKIGRCTNPATNLVVYNRGCPNKSFSYLKLFPVSSKEELRALDRKAQLAFMDKRVHSRTEWTTVPAEELVSFCEQLIPHTGVTNATEDHRLVDEPLGQG